MAQFNLQQTNSTGGAVKVVNAGDPETLILNHSTKNTVYIGNSSAVGSGNLLDATPLDPYASVVMDGTTDVWAVAAVATQEATVYTYQNAINWTPKAVQPNIIDPNSPFAVNSPSSSIILTVPPGAQGLAIYNIDNTTNLLVTGVESGITYYNSNPLASPTTDLWVPVLSDADSKITVTAFVSSLIHLSLIWIMSEFGPVKTGQIQDVNIVGASGQPFEIINFPGSPLNVSLTASSITLPVSETNQELFSNEEPVSFDVSIAAGSTSIILPASSGIQYKIQEIRIEPFTAGTAMYADVQDTTPHTFARIYQDVDGTPVNAYRPPLGSNNMHGCPIPTGLGVQIMNNGAALMRFIGHIVYSI